MISLEAQYFTLSKGLLQAVGLWPYQQTIFARIQVIILSIILATFILVQITPFITSQYNATLIITYLSTIFVFVIALIKYVAFRVHIISIKHLLTRLQCISNELKDETERAIMEKYGWNARCYAKLIILLFICCTITILLEEFWPNVLAIAVHKKNISHPYRLTKTKYFLDQEKYFYFILCYLNTYSLIALFIVFGIGTMFIAYFQYISGLFRIVSYRIKHAIATDTSSPINSNENVILVRIIRAVELHQEAMKFETIFFWLIIFGVISLSMNLFRIFQTISTADIQDLIFPILLAIICILYMFIANYVGQDITDHNDLIYISTYNVQWYRAPLPIQKMILFLLIRGTKKFTLSIGGLFDASFECFASLVKASVSYFTFVYSIR